MRDRILQPLMNLTFPDVKCTNLQAVRICNLSIYYQKDQDQILWIYLLWKRILRRSGKDRSNQKCWKAENCGWDSKFSRNDELRVTLHKQLLVNYGTATSINKAGKSIHVNRWTRTGIHSVERKLGKWPSYDLFQSYLALRTLGRCEPCRCVRYSHTKRGK